MGNVRLRMREFNQAVAAYHTAVSTYSLIGDKRMAVRTRAQVARAHMLAGRLRIAGEFFSEAVSEADLGTKAWATIACNYCHLSDLAWRLGTAALLLN